MIIATAEQILNVDNQSQGTSKKVLCVCSAGLLRSPVLANLLHQHYGYNTRSCGSFEKYALIPISEALINWADEIVFVDDHTKSHMDEATVDEIGISDAVVTTLMVPDQYDYESEELKSILIEQYQHTEYKHGY